MTVFLIYAGMVRQPLGVVRRPLGNGQTTTRDGQATTGDGQTTAGGGQATMGDDQNTFEGFLLCSALKSRVFLGFHLFPFVSSLWV